ncbi:hypothetical protein SAMN02799630_05873 [Paenibacillus sp. UNCCL117]|nr:hypothetical protein SAMN04488602_10150 [Paenibacillus sp. cl123]SFW69207.1 hypothetical protein SAMN02799630_05873 [Paenibacillus sp. UNCCL117]
MLRSKSLRQQLIPGLRFGSGPPGEGKLLPPSALLLAFLICAQLLNNKLGTIFILEL